MTRPLIKWVGGKRALLPLLVDAWEGGKHRRLIEPFAGSAAFFFAVEPEAALLSDRCWPLVEFYTALQAFTPAFDRAFQALMLEHPQPSEEAYMQVRKQWNAGDLPLVDSAAHFLYLNRFAFHGLWRVNRHGLMNVGYGHYANPPIPTQLAIHHVARVLRAAEIHHADWMSVAGQAGEGDFLYLDPPYLGTWGAYTHTEPDFGIESYQLVEAVGRSAAARGATVVISSRDCTIVRSIFSGDDWGHVPVGVVQRIAPQNGGRKPEMLIAALA